MYAPRGTFLDVLTCRAKQVLVESPAGTGKTRCELEKDWAFVTQVPGCRVLWIRRTRRSMTQSVLKIFEEEVAGPENMKMFTRVDRDHRSYYKLPNGSEIVVGGVDSPDSYMSAQYDRITVFEATEVGPDAAEDLISRLRNYKVKIGGEYFQQITFECNPKSPAHWLNRRFPRAGVKGDIVRFRPRHEDNPRHFNADGTMTAKGRDYMRTLDLLTGAKRASLRDGQWVTEERAFFNADVLLQHIQEHGVEPIVRGNIEVAGELAQRDVRLGKCMREHVRFVQAERIAARWKFWMQAGAEGNIEQPIDGSFVVAADVSQGVCASNSVIAVGDLRTRRKVAEYASGELAPEEFARLVMAAAVFFAGNDKHAFIIWEDNGPGENVGKILCQVLGASNIYRRRTLDGGKTTMQQVGGWWSTKQTKLVLAHDLDEAYKYGTYINPSTDALDEALAWITFPDGSIGPAELSEESSIARQTHGDRVIGDMLLVHGFGAAKIAKPKPVPPRPGTTAWWREYHEQQAQA